MSDSSAGALLTVRGLRHAYAPSGAPTVLDIPLLELARDETVLLTGDNGSGKSTLLRILAGLLPPRRCGHFDFDGSAAARAPAVAYLHQTPYLFSATVRANVEYGLRCCRLPLARAEEAMQWADIAHMAQRPAAQLSGGDQRRVALARIRALRPKLYLLDEPLTHLDDAGRQRVLALIESFRRENAAAIVSSHQCDIPATRRWHLAAGRLAATAAPASGGG